MTPYITAIDHMGNAVVGALSDFGGIGMGSGPAGM